MKKFFFTVTAILAGTAAMAQGPSVSVNVGYGLGTPSEVLGVESEPAQVANIYGTLGSGLNFGVTPGYMLSEHFGMEIGINYFMGTEVMMNKDTDANGSVNTEYAKSNQLRIMPNLIFSTGTENNLSAYAKAGLVLPVMGTTFSRVDDTGASSGPFPSPAYNYEAETKGQFTLGFSGSLGGAYKLSDGVSLFAELSSVNMRIKGKKTSITSYEYAGQNVLGTMNTSDKEIEYVDDYNTAVAQNNNEPTKALAPKTNFGAIFLNIGVKFNF